MGFDGCDEEVEHVAGWRRQVSTTDSSRSTKRLPASLAVPRLSFRQITPCLNARSAALLSGDTPATSANVHRCSSAPRAFRHTFAVVTQPHAEPSRSRSLTTPFNPDTYDLSVVRVIDPSPSRRHRVKIHRD